MEKLIILDYRNGIVVVLPCIGNAETQVTEWCNNNQTTYEDCYWMTWCGEIRND